MKNMKRSINIFLTIIISLITCFSLAACWSSDTTRDPGYEDREVGDFFVRFYDDYCEIKGTTEQGNSQKFLIIPECIDGIKVKSLGYVSFAGAIDMIYGDITFPDIKNESVEKVYLESAIEMYIFAFQSCPNLKKIMSPQVLPVPYDNLIGYDIYYPASVYKSITADGSYFVSRFPANVSYYYNYENPKNGGYYWIDDCDYGGKIEFIPPEPEREGYEFGGWYKEPECINKWDFETDTLPEKQTEMQENLYGEAEEVTVYQETILYAKWIKTDSPDNR